MKLRSIALVAATTALVACNTQKTENVKVGLNDKDEVKIAYMLGTQFGMQVQNITKNQLEFPLDEATFSAAVDDGYKMVKDTAFKIKYSDSVMTGIAMMMNSRARAFQALKMPLPPKKDSTDTAAAPKAPEKPAPLTAEQASDASYLLGVQFGAQIASLSEQSALDLDVAAFKQSMNDVRANAADSSKKLQLPQDTLNALGTRLREKIMEQRKAAIEKQKEEEKKLKESVAPLRGDTLSDGTQAKLNFKVKATGISVSAENLEAYAGKPLFVFYFSTTCGHCRHATPEIKAIANEFKDKGIKSIAVASGGNNKRDIRSYMEEFKLEEAGMDVFFDEAREFGELYSDGYVPKAYIVKEDGSLSTFKSFEAQKDSIKAELAKLAK
ncbi:redoxin family protein [Hallerella succinigenes]|uniref:Thiol-disulfide isomerase/thioredoxin n=1 Tax=Hallerella succinigenes TaxID=1896222 RepID=A0A2M9A4C1_9BACT|nr:FKBP-type peptidyl-prolyl cis-trans isomerase N-terminal domain-containing protein [Hallerella succinigenes]MBS7391682.1 redoxin domain-containing protein [Fibrobacter sp.]PJJ40560.1 thiol-disulfide isomerase/thioredoxin [Hallerella succinigenes]